MRVNSFCVHIGKLPMFASRLRVLLGLFVLVEIVVMRGLGSVMAGSVIIRGGLVVALARLIRRHHDTRSSVGRSAPSELSPLFLT
jgi:hypothetical protein